jgi:hypothetical protein
MIEWKDDRKRVLDKLDAIDDRLHSLNGRVLVISSTVSSIIGVGIFVITKII